MYNLSCEFIVLLEGGQFPWSEAEAYSWDGRSLQSNKELSGESRRC